MEEKTHLKNIETNQTEIPKTPLGYIWYISKPFKWLVLISVSAAVIASLLAQGSAYLFKLVIDAFESGDHQSAFIYIFLYPTTLFIVQLIYRVSVFTGLRWIVKADGLSYSTLSSHVMRHSHLYFSDRFAGSILSKISNVSGSLDRFLSELVWSYITAFTTILVTMVMIFAIDARAGLMFLLLTVILFIFNKGMSPKQRAYSKIAAQSATDLRARIVDTITNIQAVRQYVQTEFEKSRVSEFSGEYKRSNIKRHDFSEWTFIGNGIIVFIFSVAVFWFLYKGWLIGIVSTGELVLILVLFSQVAYTLVFIGRAFNAGARAIGEITEGLEDILVPYEIVDQSDSKPLAIKNVGINFGQVNFEFEGAKVFSDFSLDIPAGQRIGLVGKSGAGKTTFVSLLLRQHDIASGAIAIDGQDISKVTQDSLRENIAVVPQEPLLFHRSIRENILYGKQDATEEEMIEVAKKAQAYEFIKELPEGFDTMVGERGVKLSGGQKQRVAIARAMLKDAPILVLDEATSALDSESEVAIQQALETLMEGRTVIAVAHRLSTLREMDRIIVMEKGKIIEDGNHNQLSQADGVYQKLWNHQAGGFV